MYTVSNLAGVERKIGPDGPYDKHVCKFSHWDDIMSIKSGAWSRLGEVF